MWRDSVITVDMLILLNGKVFIQILLLLMIIIAAILLLLRLMHCTTMIRKINLKQKIYDESCIKYLKIEYLIWIWLFLTSLCLVICWIFMGTRFRVFWCCNSNRKLGLWCFSWRLPSKIIVAINERCSSESGRCLLYIWWYQTDGLNS